MLDDSDILVVYGSLMHSPPDGMDDDTIRDTWRTLRQYKDFPGDAIAKAIRMAFESGVTREATISNKEKDLLKKKAREDFDAIVKAQAENQDLKKKLNDIGNLYGQLSKSYKESAKENGLLKNKVKELELNIEMMKK